MKISQSSFKLRSAGLLFAVIVCLAMQQGVIGLLSGAGNEETSSGLSLVPEFKAANVVNRRLKTEPEAIKEIMEKFRATAFGQAATNCGSSTYSVGLPYYCNSNYFITSQQVLIQFKNTSGQLEVLISTKQHHNENPQGNIPHPYEFAIKLTFNLNDDKKFSMQVQDFGKAIEDKTTELKVKQEAIDLKTMCTTISQRLGQTIANGTFNQWGNLCIWLWPSESTTKSPALMKVQIQDADYVRLSIQVGSSHFSMKIPRKKQVPIPGVDTAWEEKVFNAVTAWLSNIGPQPGATRVSISQAQTEIIKGFKTNGQDLCYTFTELPINKESYFTLRPESNLTNQGTCGITTSNQYRDLGEISIVYIQHVFGLLTHGQLSMDSRAETVEYLLDLSKAAFEKSISSEITQFCTDNKVTLGQDEILTTDLVLEQLNTCNAGCPKANGQVEQGKNSVTTIEFACKNGNLDLISVNEVKEGADQSIRIRFMYPKSAVEAVMPDTGLPNQLILAKFNSYSQKQSIADACKAYAQFAAVFKV